MTIKFNLQSVLEVMNCEVVRKEEAAKARVFYVLKAKDREMWYDAVANSVGTVKLGYRWSSLEDVNKYIDKQVAEIRSRLAYREKRKAEQKAKDEELAGLVKIGDIYSSCWGYEANFHDYYEVVGKKGNMFILRELAVEYVDNEATSWASQGWKKPVAGTYAGEPFARKFSGGGFRISSFQYASKWDGVVREDNNWH